MFVPIIGTSLSFRCLAVAHTPLVFGGPQLRNMTTRVIPEFAPPEVRIHTEGPRAILVEAGELITVPIEEGLRGSYPEAALFFSAGLSQVTSLGARCRTVVRTCACAGEQTACRIAAPAAQPRTRSACAVPRESSRRGAR
jgi:hypothetical protein